MKHTRTGAHDDDRKLAKATGWEVAGLTLVMVIVLVWLLPAMWAMFVPAPTPSHNRPQTNAISRPTGAAAAAHVLSL